jgi:NodT family efflux transporter outer membrane factor (OMF) lipoprotein
MDISDRQRPGASGVFLDLVLLVFLFGCVKVGPDFVRPPLSVSPNWMEATDNRTTNEPADYREWWRVFDDPVLDRLIDVAYRQNLSLAIAGVRVLEARAQLAIAVGNLYPQTQQAFGTLENYRLSQHSALSASGTSVTYSQAEMSLRASWELDFWGRFRRAIESADANLVATVADYDTVLVSLTADVASSYLLVRTLEKRLEIAAQNVGTQTENLGIAEARFRGGTTSGRDVEQAKTLLNSTQSAIPALQIQSQQARNALSTLLGIPPADVAGFLGTSSGIPAPPPQVALGIPSDLLRRRPDIRSAEYRAVAQGAQIGVAKADLFPAFSLGGTFGFLSTNVPGSKLSDMFRWDSRNYVAGPSITWSLFNYGRIVNNVRLQDARFQELLINYQNVVLTAQREVEDGLAAYLRSQERAQFVAKSAEAAKASLALAIKQYEGGVTDFTTVLTSQQALLSEQDNLVITLGDVSSGLVQVYRALGGGWEIRQGMNVVPENIRKVMAARTNWGDLLKPPTNMTPPAEDVK